MLQKVAEGHWVIGDIEESKLKHDYFDEYAEKADTELAGRLNTFRANLAKAYRGSGAVLDIGIGDGAFLRSVGRPCYGFDVDPKALDLLANNGMYLNPYVDSGLFNEVSEVTFFDSLEHIPNVEVLLRRLRHVKTIIVSIPIFRDEQHIKKSKHFKPAEHIRWFTDTGFRTFAEGFGRKVTYSVDAETQIGREDIVTYVLQ